MDIKPVVIRLGSEDSLDRVQKAILLLDDIISNPDIECCSAIWKRVNKAIEILGGSCTDSLNQLRKQGIFGINPVAEKTEERK